MNMEAACPIPTGLCADESFRLAIYESGHALTARALGIDIIHVRMRPRPPTLASDKTISGNGIDGLLRTLENRVIELFGGQIAEEHVCGTNSCCSGDVARIDELCNLIAGLSGSGDKDDVWFELEDTALAIFKDQAYRDAILPIATFLNEQVEAGATEIEGALIDAELDNTCPKCPRKRVVSVVFYLGVSLHFDH